MAEVPRALNLPGQHVTDLDGGEKTLVALSELPTLGYATVAGFLAAEFPENRQLIRGFEPDEDVL